MIFDQIITSRNNQLVKWVASLHDKKGRAASRSFIAEGVKLTIEAIRAGLSVSHIFISSKVASEVLPSIENELMAVRSDDTRIYLLEETAFAKISTEKAPQGVISVIKYLDFSINIDIINKEEFFLGRDERALVLCSVRDPSNLGAIIRSAVAFGVEHLVLSSDCADIYNPKTVRSSMGTMFKVKFSKVKGLEEFIAAARHNGRRVFAAELSSDAVSLKDVSVKRSDMFIIGNEGHGIPEEISSACNNSVYIPISDKAESLNAAVAAALFMWEQSK